jgi:fucose permease
VAVSLGGIVTPPLIGVFAATALTWRFAMVSGAGLVGLAVLALAVVSIPPPATRSPARSKLSRKRRPRFLPAPTLVIVFAIVALEFSLSFWLASYLNDSVGVHRGLAVVMVSGLYASNLAGRLLASRLARGVSAELLLGAALVIALAGLPVLLAAHDGALAGVGILLAGVGIGAMFPLTSSLHVAVSSRSADSAIGQVLVVASIGQLLGPLAVGGVAQTAGLRAGLTLLPALVVLGAAGLGGYHAGARGSRGPTDTAPADI